MAKKEETKKKGIRIANRQAWVDTFVYLCPQHRGGTGPGEYCEAPDGTRTKLHGQMHLHG